MFVYKHLVPLMMKQGLGKLPKGTLYLDFGCGNGNLCKMLALDKERTVIGIDISQKSIMQAKEKNLNVDYILCDGKNLPFRSNVFDYIFIIGVLHHITHFDEAISEIARILKNKGCVIGTEPNKFQPHLTTLTSNPRILRLFPFIQEGEKPIDPRNLVKTFKDKGFNFFFKDFHLGFKFLAAPFEVILKQESSLKIYEVLSLFDFIIPPILRNSFIFCATKV